MANIPEFNKPLYTPLSSSDPELHNIIQKESYRQLTCLELIASENLTSQAVLEANASILTNKYSEGQPGARYYGGNEYIDELELLTQQRALKAFNLDPKVWGVNVQPYSGSTANFAALTALLQPQDRLMGLDLPSGGHLTHGYYTARKKITASSIYFQSLPYTLHPTTHLVDYDALSATAAVFKPRLIICGGSAYPREWDYKRLREITHREGAWLMCDMAHTSGLVAGGVVASPFDYCDVVTTTTHKTLRGPRAGMIFFRLPTVSSSDPKSPDAKYSDLTSRVNEAVFPACQGGPHNHSIAAIAASLHQLAQPEFKLYAAQVVNNARALASALIEKGYKLQSGGTDNHLMLVDLREVPDGKGGKAQLTGSKVEKVCDLMGITLNKNAIHGTTSALTPYGIRLGTSALTSRNFLEEDFKTVADFLHRAIQLALLLQKEAGGKMLKDFVRVATTAPKEGEPAREGWKQVKDMREEVASFAKRWPLPGVNIDMAKPEGFEDFL